MDVLTFIQCTVLILLFGVALFVALESGQRQVKKRIKQRIGCGLGLLLGTLSIVARYWQRRKLDSDFLPMESQRRVANGLNAEHCPIPTVAPINVVSPVLAQMNQEGPQIYPARPRLARCHRAFEAPPQNTLANLRKIQNLLQAKLTNVVTPGLDINVKNFVIRLVGSRLRVTNPEKCWVFEVDLETKSVAPEDEYNLLSPANWNDIVDTLETLHQQNVFVREPTMHMTVHALHATNPSNLREKFAQLRRILPEELNKALPNELVELVLEGLDKHLDSKATTQDCKNAPQKMFETKREFGLPKAMHAEEIGLDLIEAILESPFSPIEREILLQGRWLQTQDGYKLATSLPHLEFTAKKVNGVWKITQPKEDGKQCADWFNDKSKQVQGLSTPPPPPPPMSASTLSTPLKTPPTTPETS